MPQKSGYLSDNWASLDGLNYGVYQSALLDILQNGQTPLTVGVFGTWGSGKTTLLRLLKGEIDKDQLNKRKTIWFTAWKYEHQEALWRAFILQVIGGLYPSENGVRLAMDKLDVQQKEGVEYLERLERALYETVSWQEKGAWVLDKEALKKELIHIPFWLVFQLTGNFEAARDLGITPDLASTLERQIREHHLQQLQSMEQFADHFENAVRLILGKEGRLVIFVDDLDRCLPEKAVEILEAIKLFLDVPGTVFVLGMDREIVRRGIQVHYSSIMSASSQDNSNNETPIDGDVYLQKMVQIPFNLPPLDVDNRKKYIEFQEENLPELYRLDVITREVLARGLFPNPRQVKRALNVFNLLRQIVRKQIEEEIIEKDAISWPLLAKAVLIQSQWPELYKLWRQYPTLIQTLEEEYTRQPFSDDEALRGISTNPSIRKGGQNPSEPEGALSEPAPVLQGGVLDEYLRNRSRYALLIELLRYPDPASKGAKDARFAGLKKSQMRMYVGLIATAENLTEQGQEAVSLSTNWQQDLASGDPAKINEVLSSISEKEPDVEGPFHQSMRKVLLSQVQSPNLPTLVRVSSGDALARLGDPRFDPDYYYLPHEELRGFVRISAGSFLMGSDEKKDPKAVDREKPQHTVILPDFYMMRYPVTVAQYRLFVEASKHKTSAPDSLKGPANHPVVSVSWHDGLAYAEWLTVQLKKGARTPAELLDRLSSGWRITLPSEAEWEKAGRGPDGRIYPWGDQGDPDKANTSETGLGRTSAVGCFPGGRSPYEIEDLSGNVWEWTRSLWGTDPKKADFGYPYDPQDKRRENLKAGNAILRILRGGSWSNYPDGARVSSRLGLYPSGGLNSVGFRCVLSQPS